MPSFTLSGSVSRLPHIRQVELASGVFCSWFRNAMNKFSHQKVYKDIGILGYS